MPLIVVLRNVLLFGALGYLLGAAAGTEVSEFLALFFGSGSGYAGAAAGGLVGFVFGLVEAGAHGVRRRRLVRRMHAIEDDYTSIRAWQGEHPGHLSPDTVE